MEYFYIHKLDFIPIVVEFWPYEWMWNQDVCWCNQYWWV